MTDSNVSSSPATASDAQAAPKRARRQASTYPNNQNKPSNPFSKSAAKRGSVMALGSIEHLQHYFTKTGLATKRRSQQLNKNLVPALGPSVIPTLSVSSTPSLVFELPSPPLPPSPRPPFEEVERVPEAHPDILKPGVISDLEETERVWGLTQTRHDMATEEKQGPALLTVANIRKSSKDQFDVLSALQITTRAIRSVRNYLVALPDDETRLSVHNRHNDLTSSLRRHSQSRDRGKRTSDKSNKAARTEHPLTRIRKSALEVLETLRAIEETNRIPLSDEAYDNLSVGSAQGDMPLTMSDELAAASRSDTPYGGSSSAGRGGGSLFSGDEDDESTTSFAASQSPMVRHTVVPVNGTPKVIKVWSDDDDDDTFPVDEEKEKQPAWDQRMALNGGWLYTQVQLSSLEEPRAIIGKYLDIVDEILFGGPAVSSPPSRETSELGLQSISSPISSTQRGWERVKATLPTPSKIRRASGRASIGTQSPTRSDPLSLSPKSTMKRVESSGLLSALKDMKVSPVLSDEPEEIKDDELGEVPEVDEEDLVEEIQDDELPQWARRDTFQDDLIGRLHAMLEENITADLRPWLPDFSGDRVSLLSRLSDGQILCFSYNAVLRKSPKPWGFVNVASIHDIIGLEEKDRKLSAEGKERKGKSSWTFRRTENLRLWAAALKLRYGVAIVTPPSAGALARSPPTSPMASQFNTLSPSKSPVPIPSSGKVDPSLSVMFDARIVARKDEGWEDMFEAVLKGWMEAVLKETRERER